MFSTFSGSLAVRFHRRLAESYANGHNTDIKIICKGREFPAIKFVLCVQSDVFAKMFAGDFKESRDGVAELKDEDPETTEKLLDFCHTLGYKLAPESKDSLGPITRHMRIYIAGDKYMIPELRDMAIKNIRAACLAGWRKPVFAEAIEEAYLQTDYPIFQDIVLAVAVAAYDAYVANREEYKAFWEATLEVPGFARDMLLKIPGSRSTFANRRYICPTCSEALNLCLAPDATYEHNCNKKPFTLAGTRTLTQQMCQDLFINVNGDLVGGLSLGFQIDEMPKPSKALKPLFGKIEGRNVFGISPKPDLTTSASASNGQLIIADMFERYPARLFFPVTTVPGFTASSYSYGELAMQFVTYLAFLVILFVLTILSALGGIFGLALVLAVLGVVR